MANPVAIGLNLIITQKNDAPCLELRKVITDYEMFKRIVSAAFHHELIMIQPTFSNELQSLGKLVEKGLLYYNEKEKKYYFVL